jgi:membrane associated rhomboid family serine protease
MPISPVRIALVLTAAVALGFAWYHGGRGRWRSLVGDRFVYGVPWGTAVTVATVVAFYLLVQDGARHWNEPIVLPFVTWSYLYPTGLLTAGIAHGSPDHLASNVAGTLALAPIAEYAWGHYPPARRAGDSGSELADGGRSPRNVEDWLARPWVRAVVVFPAALLAAAYVTALFSLGPGLGFSGAVFAIAGFAVVNYPLPTVVAIVATSALQVFYQAMSRPVVRETIEQGPPAPPEWAGIGFQAHLLGFLIGALCGIALLRRRPWRPSVERAFFATLLLGLVQSLWLLVWSGAEDVFVLYRGAGVVLVLLLAMLVAVAVAGSERSIPRPLSVLPRAPTRRQLGIAWLALVALGFVLGVAVTITEGLPLGLTIGALVLFAALFALPALPPVAPSRWQRISGPVSRRRAGVVCLAVLAVLVAVPSVPVGLLAVDDGAVPGSGGVEVGDYTVTYEKDAAGGQTPLIDVGEENPFAAEQSGVIVVSADREMWTVGVRADVLEHTGEETVEVGGIGWRGTVHVERTGWEVVGNERAYVVDLTVDDETTRSFESEPVRADVRIDDHAIDVVPAAEGFLLRVSRDGSTREAPIPDAGETTTIGDLRFSTEAVDGDVRVIAETGGTEAVIAEREEYAETPGEADADDQPSPEPDRTRGVMEW